MKEEVKNNKKYLIIIIVVVIIITIAIVSVLLTRNEKEENIKNNQIESKNNYSIFGNIKTIPVTVGYVENKKNIKVLRIEMPEDCFSFSFINENREICYIQKDGLCTVDGKEPKNEEKLVKEEKIYPSKLFCSHGMFSVVTPAAEKDLDGFKKENPGGIELSENAYSIEWNQYNEPVRGFFYKTKSNYIVQIYDEDSKLSAQEFGEELLKIIAEV